MKTAYEGEQQAELFGETDETFKSCASADATVLNEGQWVDFAKKCIENNSKRGWSAPPISDETFVKVYACLNKLTPDVEGICLAEIMTQTMKRGQIMAELKAQAQF